MKTIIISALPMAALLTGCVSLSDSQMARFDRMSCGQLAVAFEYEQEGEEEAGTSAFLNSVTELTSKGAVSDRAELDSFGDQLDEDGHRAAKDYIRERQDYLDC